MIESLESRIAPAGLVAVTFRAGLLTITGDGAANAVNLAPGANTGEIAITGSDGETFTLNGQPAAGGVTVLGLTKTAKVNLGAGGDGLSLNGLIIPVGLEVQLGVGDDTFNLIDTTIAGGLKVQGSDGFDLVEVGGSVFRLGGALDFLGGVGGGKLLIGAAANDIGGNVRFTGSFGLNDFELGGTGATRVDGSLIIKTAAEVGGSFTAAGTSLQVGGDVSLERPRQGKGGPTSDRFTSDVTQIGGKLKIRYGEGTREFLVDGGADSRFEVLKGLDVTKSKGNLADFEVTADTIVLGGITARLASRFNEVEITAGAEIHVLGAVKVSGVGKFGISGPGILAGTVKIAANQISLGSTTAPLHLAGPVALTMTAIPKVSPTVTLQRAEFAASLAVTGTADGDVVLANDVNYNGAVTVKLGGGADALGLEATSDANLPGASRFFGPVKIDLGAGNDTLIIAGSAPQTVAIFSSSVLIARGSGANLVTTTGALFPAGQPVLI